jgi:aldehyde dehydrogenase (NAD+)
MDSYGSLISDQHEYFQSGETRSSRFRISQLNKLYEATKHYEAALSESLKKDLNKSTQESYNTEIGPTLAEIRFLKKNLAEWMEPKSVPGMIYSFPSTGKVYAEPYGCVLIISPWNYPFWLSMVAMAGAMAAGNCVIVKPSELAPHTSAILKKMIEEIFPKKYISIVEGDSAVSNKLLELPFNYIFFTGSIAVGKIIAQAAAKNLVPYTLELGGKSPCIIDKDVNLPLAARRLLWGKMITSGQTCVAPDYLYVHRSMKQQLVQEVKKVLGQFYPDGALNDPGYPRIVNEKHYHRILQLMQSGGTILMGGNSDASQLRVEPTLIGDVSWNDAIMQEEIFGPLLPVVEYDKLGEVILEINSRPKPLSLYIFSDNRKTQKQLVNSISFGGGLINDTIEHLGNPYLPFGGVGTSGMGSYHGKYSFDTFSHHKGVLKKQTWLDLRFRYPPYKKSGLRIAKWFLK